MNAPLDASESPVAGVTVRRYEPRDHDAALASGVNDLGQVVGQSYPDSDLLSQRAVFWDTDGTPRDLGELPDRSGSWARAINNSGHVVGRSGIRAAGEPRAVLWILEGGDVAILDLTADSDNSGDNHAQDVTDLAGGTIQIAGYTTVAGVRRPTVWTVDVPSRVVTDVQRLEELSGGGASINEVGEVALSSAAVWNPIQNLVEPLPTLSKRCWSGANGINDSGTIVGSSAVRQKGRCVSHAVVWTKKPEASE